MYSLIIFVFVLLFADAASAANCSFANPTACGSPGVNNLAVGGTATVGGAMSVSGAATLSGGGTISNAAISGGTINTATIGQTTPALASVSKLNSNSSASQLQIATSGLDSVSNDWLWGRMRWTGNITGADAAADGQIGANKLIFTDAATSVNGLNAGALFVMSAISGSTDANNTAARNAIASRIVVQGQVGPTPTIGPFINNEPLVSLLSTGYATATQGGVGGWSAGLNPSLGYYRGSLFGGNDDVWLASGASNYFYLIGREIDVSLQGTSNAYSRFGLLISGFPSTVQADDDDAAIAIVSQTVDGFNFKNGIQFGAHASKLDITGALIKVVPTLYPTPATPAFTDGIDISGGTYSGNAIKTPGFAVDGNGQINSGANTIIGSGSALATNATTGFLQIATMGGAPTGTVGAAGKAAIVIDTTNKKLCYSTGGGTWECSAAFTP